VQRALREKIAGEITMSPSPGATLRKWREEFRISVTELSGAMALSRSVISDYESGRRKTPGVGLVRRAVDAMLALDERSGGSVSARFLQDASEAIPAMAEFPRGIPAAEFLRGIGGRLLTRRLSSKRVIKGYTVIDSVKAITGLNASDYLRVFGHTTERALVFTGVKYGRSPMIVIRTHPLKPAMVVYARPGQVDPLAVQLAELENVLLATCDLAPPALLERLEKIA